MVQKIQSREYLRRFDNMTAGERGEVMNRVGEWLRSKAEMLRMRGEDAAARLQNVVQVSVGWNDAECEAWQEGVRLLSAWGVGLDRGWWPEGVYLKSAKRAMAWVVGVLKEKAANLGGKTAEYTTQIAQTVQANTQAKLQTTKDGKAKPTLSSKADGLAPARPKHIDQYVHLLPMKTQERAQEYGPLMRELDVAREKMRILMGNDHASAAQREQWAKRAVAIEKKAKGILQELDREWKNIVKQGKVAVDALGMAYVVEEKKQEDATAATKPTPTDNEMKNRHRKSALLRKWLIDTRYGNTGGVRADQYKTKWIEKYRAMVEFGGKESVTDKVIAAAKHYGIDLADLDTTSSEG